MNNVQVGQKYPSGIADTNRKALLNNNYAMALAAGDPRYSAKDYDRPGMSRGGGQWQQAGIDAAQKMAQGVADAYAQDTQAAGFNANTQLAGQQAQEQYAQQLGALQQQDSYSQAMAALQRKQQSLNFASSLLGGLLR